MFSYLKYVIRYVFEFWPITSILLVIENVKHDVYLPQIPILSLKI